MKPQFLFAIACSVLLAVAQNAHGEADPFGEPGQDLVKSPSEIVLEKFLRKHGPFPEKLGLSPNDDGTVSVVVEPENMRVLAALKGLPVKKLEISGSMDLLASGKTLDLAPLAGFKMESFWIYKVPVKDLSPIKDSGLKSLSVIGCPVADLSPLKGLPLTELNLWLTLVSDLAPLKGMRLKHLNIDVSEPGRIFDIRPLEGMELESLTIHADDVTQGMEVVRNMKSLKEINRKTPGEFWKSYDACRPLRAKIHQSGLKFARLGVYENGTCGLYFEGDQIEDLSPLKELPLTFLNLRNSKISDLRPLEGSRLENLTIGSDLLTDLSPLRGLPLKFLSISSDHVSDLSPLRDLKLHSLHLTCPKLVDLSPLRGLPLKTLDIEGCGVSDLSILDGMSLEYIYFDPERIAKGIEVLCEMKTLEQINRKDVEEFFKADDKSDEGGMDPFAE